MKLKELLEVWKDSVKSIHDDKKTYDIFVNPNKKEVREVKGEFKDVRYIIDFKKKKLYVFSAEFSHDDASNLLKLPYVWDEEIEGYYYGRNLVALDGKIISYYPFFEGEDWLNKYFKPEEKKPPSKLVTPRSMKRKKTK